VSRAVYKPEKIVALWQANRQIIDFKIWPTKIFKLNFLDFWLTDFSKNFRKGRGVDYLSMGKFKKKSIGDKFFFRKFGWGAIAPQGVPKSQKVLRGIDRGSRDLFNGVKILALSSAQLQIKEFQFYFLKFLNLIFFDFWLIDFSKFVRERRGYDCLSTHKFVGTFHLRKKVTELF